MRSRCSIRWRRCAGAGWRCGRTASALRSPRPRAAIPTWSSRLEEIVIREEAGNWAALRRRPVRLSRAARRGAPAAQLAAAARPAWRRAAAGLPAEPADALCQPADGRAMGGAACRNCCRRWRQTAGAGRSPADRTDRHRKSPPSSPRASNGAWTRNWPRRSAVATRAQPAWRSFACWRSCSRDSTRGRCRRWPPGLAARAGPVLATWRNRERRAGGGGAAAGADCRPAIWRRCCRRSRIRPGAAPMRERRSEAVLGLARIDVGTGADATVVGPGGPPRPRGSARRSPPASGCRAGDRARRGGAGLRSRWRRRKAASKPPPRAPRQHSLIWLQGLLCGAMVTLATPTALLLGVLLGPALLAIVLDREPGRPRARSIALCSMAAAVDPLRTLWTDRPQHGHGDRAAGQSADRWDGMERRGRRLAAGRGRRRSRFARRWRR